MAHKKAGGSTSLGRDSAAKRLGIKVHAGQNVKTGMIIVRQRGSKYRAGKNAKKGSDDTIFASAAGKVSFITKKVVRFDGSKKVATLVNVLN